MTAVGTRLAAGVHEDFNTRVLPLGRRCRVAEAGPMAWLVHTRQMLCCEPQEFSPTASLQPFRPMTDEGRQCFETRRR